jgi:hypothetical protein
VRRCDPAADPVLQRFKAALQDMYGDPIDRIILFGFLRSQSGNHAG